MATLTATQRGAKVTAARSTASASDSFTYVPNTNQVLELHNNTAGALTAVVKGTAPSATFSIPGAGSTTIDLSAGLSVPVAANTSVFVSLDSHAAYLAGTGAVTVTGATGMTVILLNN